MDKSDGKSQYILNLEFDPKMDWKDILLRGGRTSEGSSINILDSMGCNDL